MSCLIYDCEILKCIGSAGDPGDDPLGTKYQYCKDWQDFQNMGISVVGFYCSKGDRGIVEWEHQQQRIFFRELAASCPVIIGFNSRNFDDQLMAANDCQIKTTYDLLEEIRIAAGFQADYQSVPKGYSYSLDKVARANGMTKTGSGALAPVLWQKGEKEAVKNYCINDVVITKTLLDLGLAGKLIDPNTGETLQLRGIDG